MVAQLTLKVVEAQGRDVGRAIARLDPKDMERLGLEVGEVIQIEGKRRTVAKAMPAYPEDRGKSTIQIDGLIRENAKASLDEKATITKAQARPAEKIVLAPLTLMRSAQRSGDRYLGSLLDGLPMVEGDRIRANLFGTQHYEFTVASTFPKDGPVVINHSTTIQLQPVEVAEGKKGLTISYEDIGGLKSQIGRIREMIELPLKYPEVFERLGIEPPKGVFLYGPPGTGKTLIAKAVANETDAYFTDISGPEVIGKFYGESLVGDERILVLRNGCLERRPIAEMVASRPQDLQVPCFGPDGTIRFGKVTGFYTHRFRGKLLQVRTATGRSIRVTDDHSLFTLGAEGIRTVKTSELVPRHSFIAVPKRLPFVAKPLESLDVYELLKDDDSLVMRGAYVQQLVYQAIAVIRREHCAAILGVSVEYLSDLLNKRIGIRLPKLVRLAKAADLVIVPVSASIFSAQGKNGLPNVMPLTEDFCTFFGLWLAEGSFSQNRMVRLSIHADESRVVVALCERLFGKVTLYRRAHTKAADVIINSVPLVKLMQALGFVSGARRKRVPTFVYSLSRSHLAAVLRGYYSGDGSVNRTTPAPHVEVSTASSDLADDLCYLLAFFGIVARVSDRLEEQSKRVRFADTENLERFLEIGFLDVSKNSVIQQYVAQRPASRRDRIPVAAIRAQLGYKVRAWNALAGIGIRALKRRAESLPAVLDNALEGDLFWDQIVAIEELPRQPDVVYDIGVEPGENFIAGFGGIFAHNSEARLRKVFEDAQAHSPAIVFIDEIDAIAPKREEMGGEKQVEKRVVGQLLALMDGLESRGSVIVIAATNLPNVIDPALRRPGRFDREINIPIPDRNARLEILHIHTRGMPLAKDVDLERLADITHGFVGADLAALCREAAMVILRQLFPEVDFDLAEIPVEKLMKLEVTQGAFLEALREIEPSAIREVFVEVPNVTWQDVGGLDEIKKRLIEAVEWPLKHAALFEQAKVRPPKGILLTGPPGCGKTLLAKAVAHESEVNFISVKGPELFSKYVGESERAVREIFRKAKQASPCILFLDEVDSMVSLRRAGGDSLVAERVISQFLTELDGIEELKGVLVVAATNRPDLVDPALLRPGRFDLILELPLPDEQSRQTIFHVHTRGKPLAKDVDLNRLAKETEGLTGADIEAICREAAMEAIREAIQTCLPSPGRDRQAKGAPHVSMTMRQFRAVLDGLKSRRQK